MRASAGLALTGLFVWLLLRGVDLTRTAQELRGISLLYAAPATVVLFAGIWLRALRWQVLLRPLARVRNSHSFSALTIGYMANNALPARLGELVRVWVLSRDTALEPAAILGSIVLERIIDVLTLLMLLAVASGASGWRSPWLVPLLGIGAAALAALAAVGVLSARGGRWASGPGRLLERPLGGLLKRLLRSFASGFRMAASPRALLLTVAISLASWTVEAGVYYLVMRAVNMGEQGFWLAMLVASVSNLAGIIPAGPGNVGAFEFFAKQTAVLFGVSDEKALAFAVAAHVMVLVPPTILGFLLAWRKGFSGLRR